MDTDAPGHNFSDYYLLHLKLVRCISCIRSDLARKPIGGCFGRLRETVVVYHSLGLSCSGDPSTVRCGLQYASSQETETEENWANIDALPGISLPKGPYIF